VHAHTNNHVYNQKNALTQAAAIERVLQVKSTDYQIVFSSLKADFAVVRRYL